MLLLNTVCKLARVILAIHSFMCVCVCGKTLQSYLNPCNSMTVIHQALLSMGFSRQKYWIGLSCPPPGDLPDTGIKPWVRHLIFRQAGSFPLALPGKPVYLLWNELNIIDFFILFWKLEVIYLRYFSVQFSSIQSLCRVWLFATPWITARLASLSITNSQNLLKLMPIESVMPSSHLILCRPLLLLPPIPPRIRVFPNESAPRMRWPKYWSFSFSISLSNEHPWLISFRMDWLDLLAV